MEKAGIRAGQGESRTPVFDFLENYRKEDYARFHMPGHKGRAVLGPEPMDLTEITGADSLYEASGIISESEENAARIFGARKTVYGTEGSSQCIKTMLALSMPEGRSLHVMAARNIHRSFVDAMALLDGTVTWILPEHAESVYSADITENDLERTLERACSPVDAVYVTTPDYLGKEAELAAVSAFCGRHGLRLLVDHAHGAYRQFAGNYMHPLKLGADFVAESAHKTLPVLTGGAYLHAGEKVPEELLSKMKKTMELFGSTSPSYLTLASLDLCNAYLSDGYPERLRKRISELKSLKRELEELGFTVLSGEPLKLTIRVPSGGFALSAFLRKNRVECEYSDSDYIVLMVTPENSEEELLRLRKALFSFRETCLFTETKERKSPMLTVPPETAVTIREAVFGNAVTVPTKEAVGRIAAGTQVSCPPAIPIVIPGERITEEIAELLAFYGYGSVDVLR